MKRNLVKSASILGLSKVMETFSYQIAMQSSFFNKSYRLHSPACCLNQFSEHSKTLQLLPGAVQLFHYDTLVDNWKLNLFLIFFSPGLSNFYHKNVENSEWFLLLLPRPTVYVTGCIILAHGRHISISIRCNLLLATYFKVVFFPFPLYRNLFHYFL